MTASMLNIDENQIILQKIRKGMSISLGRSVLESVQFSTHEDMMIGKIINVSFDVLSDKIHEDTATATFRWETPSSWWEQLKKEKAPKWFAKRYPIKYTSHSSKRTVTFKRYAEYPKANIAIPKNSHLFIKQLGGLEVIRDQVEE